MTQRYVIPEVPTCPICSSLGVYLKKYDAYDPKRTAWLPQINNTLPQGFVCENHHQFPEPKWVPDPVISAQLAALNDRFLQAKTLPCLGVVGSADLGYLVPSKELLDRGENFLRRVYAALATATFFDKPPDHSQGMVCVDQDVIQFTIAYRLRSDQDQGSLYPFDLDRTLRVTHLDFHLSSDTSMRKLPRRTTIVYSHWPP